MKLLTMNNNLSLCHQAHIKMAITLLVLVAIVWGSSYSTAKFVLSSIPIDVFLALRFVLATVFFVLFMMLRSDLTTLFKSLIHAASKGYVTGIILTVIFVFETLGIYYSQASEAAVLISMCIVFTPIIEYLVLKTKQSPWLGIYLLISLSGVVLVSESQILQFEIGLGATFILIAALARACMVVACRKVLLDTSVNATSLTIVQLLTVALASLSWCLFHYPIDSMVSSITQLQVIHWLSMIHLVLFCTLIAFFAQNYAVKSLSATQSTAILGTEPIFGILFAVLLLNEALTTWQVLGSALILIATYKIMQPVETARQQAIS